MTVLSDMCHGGACYCVSLQITDDGLFPGLRASGGVQPDSASEATGSEGFGGIIMVRPSECPAPASLRAAEPRHLIRPALLVVTCR